MNSEKRHNATDTGQTRLTGAIITHYRPLWRITDDAYDRYYQSFRDKIAEIDARLALLQDAEDNYYITVKYLLDVAKRANDLFVRSEVEEKRQIIKLILPNLRMDGNTLRYEAQKPFDFLLAYADSKGKLPREDSNL